MQDKYCFDAVSTTLADILGNEHPFGGFPLFFEMTSYRCFQLSPKVHVPHYAKYVRLCFAMTIFK